MHRLLNNVRPVLLLSSALLIWGCAFSVVPTDSEDAQITLELTAYPARLSVEDSVTSEIWATVRQGSQPVEDNTLVKFATTVGTITGESQTRDGLAVALLMSPADNRPRRAEVVAQAITVRDTLDVDFILDEESF